MTLAYASLFSSFMPLLKNKIKFFYIEKLETNNNNITILINIKKILLLDKISFFYMDNVW